jgi:hypothetical protein
MNSAIDRIHAKFVPAFYSERVFWHCDIARAEHTYQWDVNYRHHNREHRLTLFCRVDFIGTDILNAFRRLDSEYLCDASSQEAESLSICYGNLYSSCRVYGRQRLMADMNVAFLEPFVSIWTPIYDTVTVAINHALSEKA